MKIAIISDIHGNWVALETVLADIERERVDQIVCLGDVAFGGAQPRECLARLRALRIPVIQGNTDAFFINELKPDPNNANDKRIVRLVEWARIKLAPDDIDFIKTFQPRHEIPLEGGNTLLCFHGSPTSNEQIILATTPDADMAAILGDHRAAVMVGGHTHIQMFRRWQQCILLNPGSVGMAFERDAQGRDYRPGFGEYAVIISVAEHLQVDLRRVPIDVAAVVGEIRSSGLPDGERLIAQWRNKV